MDGGFCIDALLRRPTRAHADLDLAVERRHVQALRDALAVQGFSPSGAPSADGSCFVLASGDLKVDVHVFAYDASGNHVYGVAYPFGSLTGTGEIEGVEVACVEPRWMFRFKTAYPPAEKDRADVIALAEHFGFDLPPTHRRAGEP